MSVLSIILLAMATLGTIYYIVSTWALIAFFGRQGGTRWSAQPLPSVSLLKPVRGLDPDADLNFTTFFDQRYPDFEALFGVLDSDDLAIPVIRGVIGGRPRASLFVGSEIAGSNNKVRALHNLARHARGDILVITDADTRVTPDFLGKIAAPFMDEQVGAVTCMYRGIGGRTVGDALEGLHMTCIFAPGVVCAWYLGGIDFGLGAAIAIRKQVLEEIGGFEVIADYLADDFQLGQRTVQAGYRVELSDYVVSDVLSREGLRSVLQRELRWSRTTQVSRPWGHLGMVVTYGFAHAVLFWLSTGAAGAGWWVLGGSAAVRAATTYIGARKCLGDREFARRIYLLPLRDLLSFGVWVAGYMSRTVRWRGRKLRLLKDGRMEALR